jgi:hypothetical protein
VGNYPVQPRAKYKRGTNGKWINITPPAPTQEEALEIFILSYEENVANLYKKLVKKILPNHKARGITVTMHFISPLVSVRAWPASGHGQVQI